MEDQIVTDLEDAIDKIFPAQTECFILFWNRIPIPFNYKYDLGDHIEILGQLLSDIVSREKGQTVETLASNDLNTTWSLEWEPDILQLKAEWARVQGDLESINKHCSVLSISRIAFLTEWSCVLKTLLSSIAYSGITIEENDRLQFLSNLYSDINKLGGRSYLYQHEERS